MGVRSSDVDMREHPIIQVSRPDVAARLVRNTFDVNVYCAVECLPHSNVRRITSIRDGRYVLYCPEPQASSWYMDEALGRVVYSAHNVFRRFDPETGAEEYYTRLVSLPYLISKPIFMFVKEGDNIIGKDVRVQSLDNIIEYVRKLQYALIEES